MDKFSVFSYFFCDNKQSSVSSINLMENNNVQVQFYYNKDMSPPPPRQSQCPPQRQNNC